MSGLTLDSGALIAIERGDARMRALLQRAQERSWEIHVPPGVVAQAWRGGPRQARLAAFLAATDVEVPVLDGIIARAVGELCGRCGLADVVDVHVVLHARLHGHRIVTSDPQDLRAVDERAELIRV